ncbi:MAG TPA: hypothetical protein VI541_04845 [Actinomycetota bacterium]|nr:hypothetical protein [Actinomycetota bacterium]
MDRREFLRLAGGGALSVTLIRTLAGCGISGRDPENIPKAFAALADRFAGDEPGLQLFLGGQEYLANDTNRITMRIEDRESRQIESLHPSLWFSSRGRVHGPLHLGLERFAPRTSSPQEGDPTSFYVGAIDLVAPGIVDLAVEVVVAGRKKVGFTALQALAGGRVPGIGQPAVSTPTPVATDPGGLQGICTRIPGCPCHESSLEAALTSGKPVVFIVASPRLCKSRVCGPVLEEVLATRETHGDRAIFIHAEPYRDDSATTISAPASAWQLDSEPWTWVIDSDGVIKARFEGPVIAHELSSALDEVV